MIRDMEDPTAAQRPGQDDEPELDASDSGDNGGVHRNSGVNNKALLPARRRGDVQHLHGDARSGSRRRSASTTRRRSTSSPWAPTTARSPTLCARPARTSPARTGSSPPTAPRSTTRCWRPRWTPRRRTGHADRQRTGADRRPDADLGVQHAEQNINHARRSQAGRSHLPVLGRPGHAGLEPRAPAPATPTRRPRTSPTAVTPSASAAASGLEHRPDAGDAGLHRLDGRHGAGLEEPTARTRRTPARPSRTRSRRATTAPGPRRTRGSSTCCRRARATSRARSRAPRPVRDGRPAGWATSPTTSRGRSRSRSRSRASLVHNNGSADRRSRTRRPPTRTATTATRATTQKSGDDAGQGEGRSGDRQLRRGGPAGRDDRRPADEGDPATR